MRYKRVFTLGCFAFLAFSLICFYPRERGESREKVFKESCSISLRMSEVSHMIERGDLMGALGESLRIEEFLREKRQSSSVQSFDRSGDQPGVHPGAVTYILNMRRIAELYHELGLFHEEGEAWERLENYLSSGGEAFSLVTASLKEASLDFKTYIAFRKREAFSKL